jgi:hypothetical protein
MTLLEQLKRQGVGILLDDGSARAELRKLSESLDDEFDQVRAHLSARGMSHWEINDLIRPPKPTNGGPERRHASGAEDWADPDWSILDNRRGSLPEFPLDTLSAASRKWVESAAHGSGVTAAHVAVPLLGIASSLIGTSRRVMASRSFTQPATCWTTVVGFSGTGKTPGIDATKRALALVERNRKEKIAEMRRAHETRRETSKAMRDAWTKQLKEIAADSVVDLKKYRSTAKEEPAMPQEAEDPGPFVAPQLHVSNATIERLAQILQVQPQGALLLSDELASLFLNMSRYSGGQDNEFWLEAWNGGHYTVERMTRPAISIDRLLIGVVGGMQPDKLARSFKGDSDGMSARFLFSWPPEPTYQPLSNDVAEVEPEIVNAITRLVGLPSWHERDDGVAQPGTPGDFMKEVDFAPRTVPLSIPAIERFEQFRQSVHTGKRALDGREREWWAKMPAHVLRLALTLAFVEWAFTGGAEPVSIDDHCMKAAVELVRDYFWDHARAALRQIGLTDRHRDARLVLQWIAANQRTEVTREGIRRDALGQKLDAADTESLLQGLEKTHWVKKVVEFHGPKGGRPSTRWRVNPALLSTAETAQTAETVDG